MGWRWIAAAGLVVAGLVGGGLFVLAGRGGGDEAAGPPAPTSTTASSTAPTSTSDTASMGHEHRPGEDGMPPPGGGVGPASPLTCAPTFASATQTSSVSPSSPSPGGATAVGSPSAGCLEVGGECVVSFSMRWSDGHVEGATRSLDRPGTVTLEGDRGATATFTVDPTDTCTAPTITYHATWPAD